MPINERGEYIRTASPRQGSPRPGSGGAGPWVIALALGGILALTIVMIGQFKNGQHGDNGMVASRPTPSAPAVPPKPAPVPSNARGSPSRPSPFVVPQSELVPHVRQMMTYAMTNGGVDHEADITAAKRRLEERTPRKQADPSARQQARAANERGRSALRESRVAEALQAFQAAYTADPTDVEIINNLGYAYLFQDDLQTAELWLLHALVLSPGRSMAWANLGHVYAAQGNPRGAVACFANAYRFAPNKETMRKSLQILARDNANDKVREAARQSLQLSLMQASTTPSSAPEKAPPVPTPTPPPSIANQERMQQRGTFCSFSGNHTTNRLKATLSYIGEGEKARGGMEIENNNYKKNAHFIINAGVIYWWNDASNKGIKFHVQKGSPKDFFGQTVKFECNSKTLDGSLFSLPSDVEFKLASKEEVRAYLESL